MFNRSYQKLILTFIFIDLVSIIFAWIFSFYLRFYSGFPVEKGIPSWLEYFALLPMIVLIWYSVFIFFNYYDQLIFLKKNKFLEILKNSFFAAIIFIVGTYFVEDSRISRLMITIFMFLQPVFMILSNRLVLKALVRSKNYIPKHKVMLICDSKNLKQSAKLLKQDRIIQPEILGALVIGDDLTKISDSFNDVTLLSKTDAATWATFFSANPCDTVLISLSYESYDFLAKNIALISQQVLDVKILPDILRLKPFAFKAGEFSGYPVLSINESPLSGGGIVLKRILDIVGSLVALLLFSLPMALVALLIRLTSRGPVVYRQERMSLDGTSFMMYKFRSMTVDAEEKTGAVWASKEDNRKTVIGDFLRKTSLDELPQLFNVLKGEMSLVGPRPERPVFVGQFRQSIPSYMLRHKVKAGITGWAQINGLRGNTSLEKRIDHDLYYIQHWSLLFDIRILFLTVFRGFLNEHAY